VIQTKAQIAPSGSDPEIRRKFQTDVQVKKFFLYPLEESRRGNGISTSATIFMMQSLSQISLGRRQFHPRRRFAARR
jgi:hypothetical protein